MSTNFNDTIPAPPAGYINVKWQTDGSGNDSAYVPTAVLNDGNTFITSLVPGDVLVWNGSDWVNAAIPSVSLETEGTPNTVQSLLNLLEGANITLTADGFGGVTIASTGGSSAPTVNPQTASYVAVIGDENNIVTMNVATANNFTVQPHSSVAYPVGTSITIIQIGAGQTTVVPGAGVTISTPTSLTLRTQFSTVAVIQTAIDVWEASGDFTLSGGGGYEGPTTITSYTSGGRAFGIVYQNTGTTALFVSVGGISGSSSSNLTLTSGSSATGLTVPSPSNTMDAYFNSGGFAIGVRFVIPPNYFYCLVQTSITGVGWWVEAA